MYGDCGRRRDNRLDGWSHRPFIIGTRGTREMQSNDAGEEPQGHGGAPDPLGPLRQRIDELDHRLLEVLSERARLVIGDRPHQASHRHPDLRAPPREARCSRRCSRPTRARSPNRTIEAIYRELMSGSFALELPLRDRVTSDRAGSFSHLAAVRHFGSHRRARRPARDRPRLRGGRREALPVRAGAVRELDRRRHHRHARRLPDARCDDLRRERWSR